jgi:hypothetical protein
LFASLAEQRPLHTHTHTHTRTHTVRTTNHITTHADWRRAHLEGSVNVRARDVDLKVCNCGSMIDFGLFFPRKKQQNNEKTHKSEKSEENQKKQQLSEEN